MDSRMDERMHELLIKSLDWELAPAEQSELESALAASPELRRERDELLSIRELIGAGSARRFGPFFAERVMNTIRSARREQAVGMPFFELLQYMFRRVAIVAAMVVAILLVYNLNQGGSVSIASAFGAKETSIEEVLAAPVEETLEEL